MSPNKKSRRQSVVDFYELHKNKGKNYTVSHFEGETYKKTYLYTLLSEFDKRGTPDQKSGSGRKGKFLKKDAKKLKDLINHKTGVSQNKLANKFDVNQSTISRQIKKQGMSYRKRTPAPKVTEKQKATQKTRLAKLARGVLRPKGDVEIIMDDESYFTLDGTGMPGNSGYYTNDKDLTPFDVKHSPKAKFPEKVMVWAVVSYRGIGQLFVPAKRYSMDSKLYIAKCLPLVKKFIDKNYSIRERKKCVFWPDLASCHYANATLAALEAKGIQYIEKELNPPNAPQIRPIEPYWSILKQRVYANNWSAKNKTQLISKIKKCAKEIQPDTYQNLFGRLKTKIRRAHDRGLQSLIK